ncbi:amino acid transporter, AAT family/GABA permease [Streptomyces sp. di188]|nr:amino acid transporter, AAT family/GABA permease [Streptomyces sp. di188]SCD49781.1 amino acid transporter, AAT family/GABA permease [Streptomyces sp. di50b]
MIAIGGVVGAGLFVGSSTGIAATGPGVLLSYALVGTLVVPVMRMPGEMSAANPTTPPARSRCSCGCGCTRT